MKKIIAILVALLLVGLLLGCTQENTNNTNDSTDSGDNINDGGTSPELDQELDSSIINEDEELDIGEMI